METSSKPYRKFHMKRLYTLLPPLCLLIIGLAVLTVSYYSGREDDIFFHRKTSRILTQGWIRRGDADLPLTSFPYTDKHSTDLLFSNTLPENLELEYVLVIPNHYQRLEVSVGDKIIYQYGMNLEDPRFMPANLYCLAPILPEYSGQEITIRLQAISLLKRITLDMPFLAPSGEILGQILMDNLFKLLFCMVTGTISLVLVIASALLRFRSQTGEGESKSFFYLGLFMLIAAFWLLTDSNLGQFLFANSQLCLVLSFEAFMLMPVPLLLFVGLVCCRHPKGIRILLILYAVNFAAQNLLYLSGARHFMHMLPVTHILMVGSILTIIGYMIRELCLNHSIYAKWTLIGIGLFISIGSLSLFFFYRNVGRDYDFCFMLGFFIYMVIMVLLCMYRFQQVSRISVKTKIYREMAYTDVLTGLGNRMLYEKRLKYFQSLLQPDSAVSIVMLDINNLKTVNDTEGHTAGDLLIRDAAECIRDAFGDLAECFRLGGDEFLVLLWGQELSVPYYQKRLNQLISHCNMNRDTALSVASGYAVKKASDSSIDSLQALVQKADADMYREKQLYHCRPAENTIHKPPGMIY